MNAIPRLLLLQLLVALAAVKSIMRSFWFHCALGMLVAWLGAAQALAVPSGHETFYPGNHTIDVVESLEGYVVKGGCPNGNDAYRVVAFPEGEAPLGIYEICLPPGKNTTDFEVLGNGVYRGRGENQLLVIKSAEFTFIPPVPPLVPRPAAARIPSAVAGAAVETSIPVSNSADSFAITCDGRFAVVVGRGPAPTFAAPVSLVDLAAGSEVDTLPFNGIGTFVAACDDGESVLVLINDPSNTSNSLRRLRIVDGKLVDTGERLDVPGTEADRLFLKVGAVPGSKVGVALGLRAPGITTFSIPGLQVLDTSPASFVREPSAAVSCAGDKIYLRTRPQFNGSTGDQIYGFTLDPVTGALGDTPFPTIEVAGNVQASAIFGDALAISRDGTRLIVPERAGDPAGPPTPRVSFFDTTTGERAGFFDAFGAEGAYPTLVSTIPCCMELPAVSTVLFQKGDPAPGAGGGAGKPPADARLSSFGVPAIDAFGQPAFTAKWTSTTGGKGSGLFTDTGCVATIGGAVPAVSGATFKKLADPLIDNGRVAFLATLAGVPKAASSAVLSDAPGGALAVIARTGGAAPGADGATFKSFSAVGLEGVSVGVLAKLNAATTADIGLWAQDATHPLTLLLREGQTIGGKTIETLISCKVGNGSPGQGRGWLLAPATGTQALALAAFTDGTQAVVVAAIDGTVSVVSQSGPGGAGGPDIPGASFASYGVPAANLGGHSAFAASLTVGAGGATKANARGIFANLGTALYAPLARAGDPAGTTGGTFDALKDPVLVADDAIAFPATLAGVKGSAKATLWHRQPAGALTLIAQSGATAPGTDGQWESFPSLALVPGRGPLFSARLIPGNGGVKASNAEGVWATDPAGKVSLLFRTGQTLGDKKLGSFSLLNASAGSLGATRSFNATGTVVWRATFTDQSTAIVATDPP